MTALPFRTGWGEARYVPASHGATRLERLERLHLIAKDSEMNAMPCTPERALRRQRADRIMEAIRDEMRAQVFTEPCATCGQPARPETGLCERCRESYDAVLSSDRAYWLGEGL
ncbi:hypothetical protein [Deinococcus kurensis]|uniref:hypothetical protein n=1 Tax=Deinococcus kurensis TaxID=2662757 RepID=UPI0012D355C0|nr:hypothetical protein [Deinococcus kurensis]